MLQIRAWLLAAMLACTAQGAAAAAPAAGAPTFTPVAHSTLVTLAAARLPSGLSLRLHPTQGGNAPFSVTELAVSIDGKSLPATRLEDGSWSVAWPASAAPGNGKLEVIVTHDGIREVLTGELPAAGGTAPGTAGGAASILRDHKQMAWWILNIAIVLIAAIAISRRTS